MSEAQYVVVSILLHEGSLTRVVVYGPFAKELAEERQADIQALEGGLAFVRPVSDWGTVLKQISDD